MWEPETQSLCQGISFTANTSANTLRLTEILWDRGAARASCEIVNSLKRHMQCLGNEMSDATEKEGRDHAPRKPAEPYWEDPVYRYVSRRHRSADGAGDSLAADNFAGFMQELVDGSMSAELYRQLDEEAKAERRRQRDERKSKGRRPPKDTVAVGRAPSVNIADLKKRIFNPQVSRDNVIKALEALPPREKKATIAGFPPGLRRKLGDYLKGGGH